MKDQSRVWLSPGENIKLHEIHDFIISLEKLKAHFRYLWRGEKNQNCQTIRACTFHFWHNRPKSRSGHSNPPFLRGNKLVWAKYFVERPWLNWMSWRHQYWSRWLGPGLKAELPPTPPPTTIPTTTTTTTTTTTPTTKTTAESIDCLRIGAM